YRSVTASAEFRELERLRSKALHDEAQALYDAEQKGLGRGLEKGRSEEREKWQSVVADKDSVISKKEAELTNKDAIIAELMKRLGEDK
ncbi:MAG: hypothetical protein FWC47_09695, partial [Oscillospiraceae bacterium]|nr:hypothetical protein [Oscillospiraceae bacterium]